MKLGSIHVALLRLAMVGDCDGGFFRVAKNSTHIFFFTHNMITHFIMAFLNY